MTNSMLAFLSVLLAASAVGATVDSESRRSILAQVCNPDEPPFEFRSVNQVLDLIDNFMQTPEVCPPSYHEAFAKLDRLLRDDVVGDICSLDAYVQIRDFHSQFISYFKPDASKEWLESAAKDNNRMSPIPPSLSRFFILFVLQISASCKRELVHRLESEVSGLINDEDFEVLDKIKSDGARILGEDYRSRASELRKLTVVPERADKLFVTTEEDDNKLYIQVRFGDSLKKIKDACERKFKPIYDELFVPVIRLNNLGYYDRVNSRRENELLKSSEKFKRWYGIIETCEIFKDIEVVQDSSTISAIADLITRSSMLANTNGKDIQKVTILTREEANQLRAQIASNIESHDSVTDYEPSQVALAHQAVQFAPQLWAISTQDRDSEVKRFRAQIKKLISDRTSAFKLWRKDLANYLRTQFRKYKVQFVNKDQSSAAGRLGEFMERHKMEVRFAVAIFAVVLLAVHVG